MSFNKIFLYVLAAFSLVIIGCFSSNNTKHYYQVFYAGELRFDKPVNSIVRVKTFEIDKIYKKYNIVYRTSPYEMFYYNNHLWAVKPDDMITDAVTNHIKQSGMFSEVISKLEKKPDYVISGRIVALDEIDSGDRWYARAALLFTVSDFMSGKVLYSHYFDRRKEVFNSEPVYIVRAISEIIEEETAKFLKDSKPYLFDRKSEKSGVDSDFQPES